MWLPVTKKLHYPTSLNKTICGLTLTTITSEEEAPRALSLLRKLWATSTPEDRCPKCHRKWLKTN